MRGFLLLVVVFLTFPLQYLAHTESAQLDEDESLLQETAVALRGLCERNGPVTSLLTERLPSLPLFSSVHKSMRETVVGQNLIQLEAKLQEKSGSGGSSSMCFVSLTLSIATLIANLAAIWFAFKVNGFFNDLCRHCYVQEATRQTRSQTLVANVPDSRVPGDLIEVKVNGDGWQKQKSVTVQLPPNAKPGTPILIVSDDSARTSTQCNLCRAGGQHWVTFKKYVLFYFVFDILSSIAMKFCSLRTTSSFVQYLIALENSYMGPHYWSWPVQSTSELRGQDYFEPPAPPPAESAEGMKDDPNYIATVFQPSASDQDSNNPTVTTDD